MDFDEENPFSDNLIVGSNSFTQNDPFVEGSDPFAKPEDVLSTSLPMISPSVVPQIPEDPEEILRQSQRDEENRERQKKLQRKDDKERDEKDKKRQNARAELAKWYADREKLILQTKELNISKEKELMLNKSQSAENPNWKRIGSMLDSKENIERKEQSRMRSVLISKKHEAK